MKSKVTLEELDFFNNLIGSTKTPTEMLDVLEILISRLEDGTFYWQNSDLKRFLNGMYIAVESYVEPKGEFVSVAEKGPWAIMSDVVGSALCID